MSSEKAMRARVAGKQAIESRLIWQLDIGLLRTRCIAAEKAGNGYIVQARTASGWKQIIVGIDPMELFRKLNNSEIVESAMAVNTLAARKHQKR